MKPKKPELERAVLEALKAAHLIHVCEIKYPECRAWADDQEWLRRQGQAVVGAMRRSAAARARAFVHTELQAHDMMSRTGKLPVDGTPVFFDPLYWMA